MQQKNIFTLATARLKNLFCTILPLLSSLRRIGVLQEVYCLVWVIIRIRNDKGYVMLKDILYTGLGMGVVLKEKVESEIKKLEEEGKLKKDDAASLVESLSSKGKEEEERIKELFKASIKEVIDELGLATKEDIEKLKDTLSKD